MKIWFLLWTMRFTKWLLTAVNAHIDAVVKLALDEGREHQRGMTKLLLLTTDVQSTGACALEVAELKSLREVA